MELVLKTSGQKCLVGSNPTPSALALGPVERSPPRNTRRTERPVTHSTPARTRRAAAASAADPSRAGALARHGRLPVTQASSTVVKWIAGFVGVLLVGGIVVGGIAWAKLWGGIQIIPSDPGQQSTTPPVADIQGGINILVIGSDDRTGQGAEFGEGTAEAEGVLNDVNILVHISADRSNATAVSLPRDTLVDTPVCTNDKGEQQEERSGVPLNSTLGEGGMNCVVATVEKLSGIDVHYSAMVKFRGVIALSNAVGGVTVCVANPIVDPYTGLDIPAGNQKLQGMEALQFLRTRHGVGDGSDLSRISNQQVFLSALMREMKSSDTLTNPFKLYGIASAVTQNMVLSAELNNLDTLMGLAGAVSKVPIDQIVFAQLPVGPSEDDPNRVVPLHPDADVLWTKLRNDEPINVVGAPTDTAAPAPTATEGPAPDASAPVDPSATPSGTPVPTASIPGQRADQETCSNVEK